MSKNGKRLFRNFDPYITSPFGWRIHPISKVKSFHQGVDYGTNNKVIPTYALEDGKVVGTGSNNTNGKYVYVNFPRLNHNAIYQHLNSISVKSGQKVTKDTVIGYTGATGAATGIHLHFGWFPSANQNKAWDNKGWEDFEKYNYPENNTTPSSKIKLKYKVGDVMLFTGRLYEKAVGTGAGATRTNLKCTITKTYDEPGTTKPYNINNGLGWVAESDLKPYTNTSNSTSELKVGSKVKYTGYLYVDSQGNGRGKKVSGTYTVSKIINAPYGIHLKDWGWVKKSDCKII